MITRFILIMVIALLPACMPSPYPVRSVTYELNEDINQWTVQDCLSNLPEQEETKAGCCGPRDIETVCYKKQIAEPPPGVQQGETK